MVEAHVVTEFVAESVAAQSTGQLCQADHQVIVVGGGGIPECVTHSTHTLRVLDDKNSSISRTPQVVATILVLAEGTKPITGVMGKVGFRLLGLLDAMQDCSQGDLAVDVALVGRGDHLFGHTPDVTLSSLYFWCVVQHDGVCDNSSLIVLSHIKKSCI